MEIQQLLREGRGIWGEDRLNVEQVCIRLGVSFGDVCRYARGATKDAATHTDDELKKELGNVIFSTIRWCDDLGFDPEECVQRAVECQKKFAQQENS